MPVHMVDEESTNLRVYRRAILGTSGEPTGEQHASPWRRGDRDPPARPGRAAAVDEGATRDRSYRYAVRQWSPPVRPSPSDRVELVPNLRRAWLELPLMLLGLALLTTVLTLRGDPAVMVLGADVLVAVVLLALFIGARNLRVFADNEGAGWVDRLGRTGRFPPGTKMRYSRTWGGASQLFIEFVGPNGSRLFSSSARLWDVMQLESLCTRFGIEVETTAIRR